MTKPIASSTSSRRSWRRASIARSGSRRTTRTATRSRTRTSSGLASEEKALQRSEQLVAVERLDLRAAAVDLRYHRVVLECVIRRFEAVIELVALPDVVV